jgi:protein ImuA
MASASTLYALRRQIDRLERAGPFAFSVPTPEAGGALSFGHGQIDARFEAGGLSCGVHQVAGRAEDPLAPVAFAFMLLARRLDQRPAARALVVQEVSATRETGAAYGPGLHALGLDPGRLVFVSVPDGGEALRVVNDALRLGAADTCLVALRRGAGLADLSVTRRFNLAAARTKALVLLTTPDLSVTSAALTRWRVASAGSGPERTPGAPTLEIDLMRNRHGRLGRWTLQWNSHDRTFQSPHRSTLRMLCFDPPPSLAASVAA